MNQQQIVKEFRNYSKAEKSVVIRELLQIFEKDLINEKSANGNADIPVFTIEALSLEPRTEFDFDNIAELIQEVEGDFYK